MAEAAVELPLPTKRRLGLDEARSWIVVTEGNRFACSGPDLRPVAPGRFDYGLLPPALFQRVRERLAAWHATKRLKLVPRTD